MRIALMAALAAGALWAGGALAMMPPGVYEEGRADAPYHLLVEIVEVAAPAEAIGVCGVTARVVDEMRDRPDAIAPDQVVRFDVDCLRSDADPNQIPDCVIFQSVEALLAGRHLEVYLDDGRGTGFDVVLGQAKLVDASPGAS